MAYTKVHVKQNSTETSSCCRRNLLWYASHKYCTMGPSLKVSLKDIPLT